MLPPIEITKAESITVKVGDNLNVITPNVTKVTTTNAKVLAVSQPTGNEGSDTDSDKDAATFNAGAKVVGPGAAKLTVYGGITNSEMYTVEVTANQS